MIFRLAFNNNSLLIKKSTLKIIVIIRCVSKIMLTKCFFLVPRKANGKVDGGSEREGRAGREVACHQGKNLRTFAFLLFFLALW